MIVSLSSIAEFFVGGIIAGFGVFAVLSASIAYFGRRTAVVPVSETYGAPTI